MCKERDIFDVRFLIRKHGFSAEDIKQILYRKFHGRANVILADLKRYCGR